MNVLGVDVAVEQQRGTGMPEVLESDRLGQRSTLQELLEGAHDVAVRQGRADGRGEDETVVPP